MRCSFYSISDIACDVAPVDIPADRRSSVFPLAVDGAETIGGKSYMAAFAFSLSASYSLSFVFENTIPHWMG